MSVTTAPAPTPAPTPAPKPGTVHRSPAGARRRRVLYWIATHAIAVALAIMFLAPFAFIGLTALMNDQQALTTRLWPDPFHWSTFVEVFDTGIWRWIGNSLLYAGLGTAFMLVSSIPVAYALARFRFRGRKLAFVAVITMMMLPPQVIVVPMYIVWARFGLTGTLWPIILPLLFSDAFSVFLLRQFLISIPKEYADAARVDGCGEFRTMLRVILPMAKPAIAAVGLFQFFYCWNDYFGPLVYAAQDPHNWTLAIGLASFRALHHVEWNLTMAATIVTVLPVLVVFFFAQRVFIQGVTLTGVKG